MHDLWGGLEAGYQALEPVASAGCPADKVVIECSFQRTPGDVVCVLTDRGDGVRLFVFYLRRGRHLPSPSSWYETSVIGPSLSFQTMPTALRMLPAKLELACQ